MNFLGPGLLMGGLVAAVPLVLHLLNRHRHRRVDWAATRLLVDAVAISRRTIRWEQLLLLAIRVAIPVALAFCLARPYLPGAALRSESAGLSLTLVLDNSLSMACRSETGETRYNIAKARLTSLLNELEQSSIVADVALFSTTSVSPIVQRTSDLSMVAKAIEGLPVTAARSSPKEAMSAARDYVLRTQRPAKALWVASDFQRETWTWSVDSVAKDERATSVNTALLSCGRTGRNCFPNDASFPTRVLVGQTFELSGTWACSGAGSGEAPERCVVEVTVDGQNIFRKEIARGERFECVHSFDQPGQYRVVVDLKLPSTIEQTDIAQDNRQQFIIQAQSPTRVLLVLSPAIEKCLPYLTSALEPFGGSTVPTHEKTESVSGESVALPNEQPSRFQLSQAVAEQVAERDFESVKVIVLAADAELGDDAMEALEQCVANGAGVMLLPPGEDDVQTELLELLRAPKRYAEPERRTFSTSEVGLELGSSLAGSGLEQFAAERLTTRVPSRFMLTDSEARPDTSPFATPTKVWLSDRSGRSLIVASHNNSADQGTPGHGRIVQYGFLPHSGTTNLVLRSAFPALLNHTASWLANAETEKSNYIVGDPIPEMSETFPKQPSGGQPFTQLAAGFHEVRGNRAERMRMETRTVALNVAEQESYVETLTSVQLERIAETERFELLDENDSAPLAIAISTGDSPLELWAWVLPLVLCLLVAEVWWQGRVASTGLRRVE